MVLMRFKKSRGAKPSNRREVASPQETEQPSNPARSPRPLAGGKKHYRGR